MQRVTVAVEVGSQVAVSHARAHRYRARLSVQRHPVEILQRDLISGRVGDAVKRVAGPQRFHCAAVLHQRPQFLYGLGNVQVVGPVLVIAGPVRVGRAFRLISR